MLDNIRLKMNRFLFTSHQIREVVVPRPYCWHRIFAWLPVIIDEDVPLGDFVLRHVYWLSYVQRKRVLRKHTSRAGKMETIGHWEYRPNDSQLDQNQESNDQT